MKKIGFIGLGIMGKPMVQHLLKADYHVYVYARRPDVVDDLNEAGINICPTIKELASEIDVLITMVSATADVEDILTGKEGIIHTAKSGLVVIDMSTIAPSTTINIAQRLAEKNIEMLDAPVSGGEQGAIQGTLSIMVGGKDDTLAKVLPILKKLGKHIVHIGNHGAGQIAKACNQLIIAETIVAVDEALRLAKASGVDPNKVREALLGGFASSRVLEIHGKRMLEKDYTPGFKASLHRKDMHLALDQASHVGVYMPAAKHATQCIDQLVLKGHSDLDSSAVHLLSED